MRSIAILLAWLALSSDGRRIGQTLNQAKKESLGSAREVQAFNPSALGGHSLTKNTALANPPHAVLHRHQQILASEGGVIPLDDLKVGAEVEGKIVSLEPYAAFIDIGAEAIAFLPTSDVSDERINITDRFSVGEAVKCKIKEVNMKAKTLRVSTREEIGKPLDNFRIGMHVEGKIVNLQTWGAFLDIGTVINGFLHRTEVSLKRNQTVKDVFTVDEVVKCRILDIENVPRRLSLTCIKDTKTPLEELEVGTEVEGKVLRVSSFGVFFDIGAFEDALLHRTFMLGEPPEDLTERYTVGKSYKCRLVDVDLRRKQIALAEVGKDVKILQDIVIGSEVEGTVVSHQSWGVFLDIGARKLALLHRSEVPDEYAENLKEKYPVGETVKCRIQSIDPQKSSVSVTCKSRAPLEDLKVGTEVDAKVLRVEPFGVFFDIGAVKDGFLHQSDVSIEDNFSLCEVVRCRIKEVDVENNQISLTIRRNGTSDAEASAGVSRIPLEELKVGTEIEGRITRVEQWCAFVDIGAVTNGMLHESKMTLRPKQKVKDKFTPWDWVKCTIKNVDLDKKHIELTTGTPLEDLKVGTEVEAKVLRLQPWGAFVDIGAVKDALLHKSDISLEPNQKITDKLSVDDVVKCRIEGVDLDMKHISLSCKDSTTSSEVAVASNASTSSSQDPEVGLEDKEE